MKLTPQETELSDSFLKLIDLIRTLRSENGCPWDKKQTVESFHPYILEEYHELVHAVNANALTDITDEMGDLLFLTVFTAYMFEQQGFTNIKEIIDGSIRKMTRRHPHVFGDVEAETPEDVVKNWRKIKDAEEPIQRRESLLDGIPRTLPSLFRAQKLARRAARVGFDWTKPEEVLNKVDEEIAELKDAMKNKAPDQIREELGDLLFVITNAARHLEVDSESALIQTCDKFEKRFRYIESEIKSQGKSLDDATLAEMDELWEKAKTLAD